VVAFLKKSSAKDFCSGLPGVSNTWLSGQKFFAERRPREGLFYKKATA
jgi:hypothetical protein